MRKHEIREVKDFAWGEVVKRIGDDGLKTVVVIECKYFVYVVSALVLASFLAGLWVGCA